MVHERLLRMELLHGSIRAIRFACSSLSWSLAGDLDDRNKTDRRPLRSPSRSWTPEGCIGQDYYIWG